MKFFVCLLWAFVPIVAQTDDLAAKSHLAKQEMTAGDFTKAAVIYRELIRALPDDPGLRMNLGLALHSAGQYRDAIQAFQVVLRARPDFAPALLFLGLAHAKLGEAAAAIASLERALKADPSNQIALLELGDAYLQSGHPADAVGAFDRLIKLDPASPKAWHGLGLSYNALAQQAFSRLEKNARGSSYWYALAARSRLDQQRYGSAFYLYKCALDAKPRDLPGVHAGLAEVYRQTGHADWARIEESREAAHHDASATDQSAPGRSDYESATQNASKAMEAFSRLSQLPSTAEIHALLGHAARMQERYVPAEQEYREALRLDPSNRVLENDLAETYWMAHDFDAALPMLQRLLAAEPSSAKLNFEMGDILLGKNQAAKAIPFLTTALTADPRFLPAHASIAKAYLQLGSAAEAIPHLKAALPGDADGSLRYQLARAYKDNGQPALAERTMKEFSTAYRARQKRREQTQQEAQIVPP